MLTALIMAPAAAAAANPAVQFDQAPLPYDRAIIEIASRAKVTVGAAFDLSRCGDEAPTIKGRMSALQALQGLLQSSRCEVAAVQGGAFRITLRPAVIRRPPVDEPQPPAPLEPTIVTAIRRSDLLGRAPGAVSVVDSSMLLDSESLASVAPYVAGMTTTNLGPGRDKILLRGLSDGVYTGRTQSTVGLYLDDTPITYNAPDPDLLLEDISRVEVLKGPQGALYGDGAISGVVRLVTRRPDLLSPSALLTAGAAMTEGGAPSARVSGVVNAPIMPERLAFRLVVYDEHAGGYIKDQALGRSDINQTSRIGQRLSIALQLTPGWKITSVVVNQSLDSANSQYVSGNLGAYARHVPIAEPYDNDFLDESLTVEGPTPLGDFRASVDSLRHQLRSRFEASAASALFPSQSFGSPAYDENQSLDLTTAKATLNSSVASAFGWLAGAYLGWSRERFYPRLHDLSSGLTAFAETRRDQLQDAAVFGETNWSATPRLSLTAGLRLSRYDQSTNSQIDGATPSAARQQSTRLAYKAVAAYQITQGFSAYVEASEGYRNGGFNTTALPPNAPNPAQYAGDELNNYEAGLKLGLDQRRLLLSISAFHDVWNNIQSDQLQPSGLPVTNNIGDGLIDGLEIEGDWAPWTRLSVHASAQLNAPRLTKAFAPYSIDNSGLPFISRVNASLIGQWRTILAAANITTSAVLSYRSSNQLNFDPFQDITMGGYATLDLGSTVTLGAVRYSLRMDNVTGERGNTFAYGNPFSLARSPQSTPLRPRTVWLLASFAF